MLDLFAGKAAAAYGQLESLLSWGIDQAERAAFRPRKVHLFHIIKREIILIPESNGVLFANEIGPE